MQIVTGGQMRAADEYTIHTLGIPGAVLMENAARGVFEVCKNMDAQSFVVLCGKGNNGGDGYALSRYLYLAGKKVQIFSIGADALSGDALLQFEVVKKLGVSSAPFEAGNELPECDVIVDALLGTGIKGEVSGLYRAAIEQVNQSAAKKLAVDIPSGVCADTGRVAGTAVQADITVTLACPKVGLVCYPGREYAGRIVIADIGIPPSAIEPSGMEYVESACLPKREANSHKGSYGRLCVVGGSVGMAGAACLSGTAAVKGGSGLVTVCVPESILLPVSSKLTEAMALPLPDDGRCLHKTAWAALEPKLMAADAVVLGCGMGVTEGTVSLTGQVLEACRGKVVLDADGINAACGHKEWLKEAIITPHPGEMARLMDTTIQEVQNHRLRAARSFAAQYGCTVVLKGAGTIVAGEDGTVSFNSTGNPGMATGGSGDVLSGLIASFLGQGMDRKQAATLGVYFHGLAGDMAAREKGEYGMSAADLLETIPYALKQHFEGGIRA